jgi:hypothetical protein
MNLLKTTSLVCLFVCGLGFTALGLAALKRDVAWGGRVGNENWLQFRVHEGNVYWVLARRIEGERPRGRSGVTLFRGNMGRLGFYRGKDRRWSWGQAVMPLWLVVGALVIPSGTGIVRGPLRRRYRLRRGLCEKCGYDVSACVGGRCSECGAAFVRAPSNDAEQQVSV